jgi:tyrosyl-DNA phosphodiesterase 1
VDFILEMGVDEATGQYVIPDECTVGHDRIQQQLKVISGNRSGGAKDENPGKVAKVAEENVVCIESDDDIVVIEKPAAAKASTSKKEEIVEPKSSNQEQTSSENTATVSQSVADFFKERREKFAAKDPKTMQATSPPPKQTTATEIPAIPAKLKPFFPLVLPRHRMAEKLRLSAPYNMFLTAVTASPNTHNDPSFITFLDLLDPSLGELESSVQINFTVCIDWLFAQYTVAGVNKLPMVLLYGQEDEKLASVNQILPNIQAFMIKVPAAYGCHHAKVMLLFYKDKSMRVVVSTANLYRDDWHNRVQGLWVSEKLPAMDSDPREGESVTNFRGDLVDFLENYKLPALKTYIDRVRTADFRSVKVFLVKSIPGTHIGDEYGHLRLASLLEKHSAPVESRHPVIMQSSSLGNYGNSVSAYLTGEIVQSFSQPSRGQPKPPIRLIYPSLQNVRNSHDGILGGGCLPYHQAAQSRQLWLNQHLYQWKCESRFCNRAMPHIKSYFRYSDEGLYWFALTSHNMSKSAWGVKRENKRDRTSLLNINSYEAGVVFFPRIILGQDTFPLNEQQQSSGAAIFKLPFDVPPTPYTPNDTPFCIESMQEAMFSMM